MKANLLAALAALVSLSAGAAGPSTCVASSSPVTLEQIRKTLDAKKIANRTRGNLVCVAAADEAALEAARKKATASSKGAPQAGSPAAGSR